MSASPLARRHEIVADYRTAAGPREAYVYALTIIDVALDRPLSDDDRAALKNVIAAAFGDAGGDPQ